MVDFQEIGRGGGGGGSGYGISMALEYFQKFLDKPMQRGSDFGGR